jgi:hypothetical protein
LTIVPNGANNRLTRWGGKTYSYDPNGNLLADGTHSYQRVSGSGLSCCTDTQHERLDHRAQ